MNGSRIHRTSLVISGLILLVVGSLLLLDPALMHASNGVDLGRDPNLLSEVRAPGGALLALGALIVAGAFLPRITYTASLVAALVYGAYGLSRLVSMAIDGMPGSGLVITAGLELVIGAVNFLLLWRGERTAAETEVRAPAWARPAGS